MQTKPIPLRPTAPKNAVVFKSFTMFKTLVILLYSLLFTALVVLMFLANSVFFNSAFAQEQSLKSYESTVSNDAAVYKESALALEHEYSTDVVFETLFKRIQAADKNIYWQNTQSIKPNGVDINLAMFSSSLSPIDTASIINKQHPVFQKVLTMPNRVVLSGVYENHHWLADINSYKNGATGYVSSLKAMDINLD